MRHNKSNILRDGYEGYEAMKQSRIEHSRPFKLFQAFSRLYAKVVAYKVGTFFSGGRRNRISFFQCILQFTNRTLYPLFWNPYSVFEKRQSLPEEIFSVVNLCCQGVRSVRMPCFLSLKKEADTSPFALIYSGVVP